MRKVIVTIFVSLDGYTAGPHEEMDWVTNGFDPAMGADMAELQASAGGFLMGRRTYEILAQHWPGQTEATSPGADMMNRTWKLVASNTLTETPWGTYGNAALVKGDAVAEVRKMKTMAGRDLVTFGSPRLVESLLGGGGVDRVRLWLHPVVLGDGKPFFRAKTPLAFTLVASKSYPNGVLALDYEPTRGPGA